MIVNQRPGMYSLSTEEPYVRLSAKQATIVDSTMEAEQITASEASKEATWMKKLIGQLGMVPSIEGPIP